MTKWTDQERAHLLASVDNCVARGGKLKDDVILLMTEYNYHRTWSQIRGQIRHICIAYSQEEEKGELERKLVSQGSACLDLPEKMKAEVAAAQASIHSTRPSEAAQYHEGNTNCSTHITPKKRARVADDADNSPKKHPRIGRRNRLITRDENQDEDSNRTEDTNATAAAHQAQADDRKYCLCQQDLDHDGGDMIGCDNKTCLYEWFHLECVDISEIPVGVWFCPDCDRQRTRADQTRSNEQSTGTVAISVSDTREEDHAEQATLPPCESAPASQDAQQNDKVKVLEATVVALQNRVEDLENELEVTNLQHIAENRQLFQDLRDKRAKLDEDMSRRRDYIKRERVAAQQALSRRNEILTKELADLKERSKEMESLQEDKMQAMQVQHRDIEKMLRKEIEILKKHTSRNEDSYQQEIDVLQREYEEKRKICEDENDQWKTYGVQQRKDWMQLTGGNYLTRLTERWPVEFELNCLRGDWEQTWRSFKVMISATLRSADFQEDFFLDNPTQFGSLLHRVCGQAAPEEPMNVSQCFQSVSIVPCGHRIVESLIGADILEWCFTSSFHTQGMGSQKLDQMWESIAHYGGLEELRTHDRLSITRRVSDEYFQNYELPAIAAKKARHILNKFAGYFPGNDETIFNKLKGLLEDLMKIKLDLLVSDELCKLAYIPPGTPFDLIHMTAVNADRNPQAISASDAPRFRTTLCLYPSLVVMKEDRLPARGQGPVDGYRDVLAENRNFFPETAGQYKDWNKGDAITLAKAVVIVEEIPQEGQKISREGTEIPQEGASKAPDACLHETAPESPGPQTEVPGQING